MSDDIRACKCNACRQSDPTWLDRLLTVTHDKVTLTLHQEATAELAALRTDRDKFQMIAEEATDVCRSVQEDRERLREALQAIARHRCECSEPLVGYVCQPCQASAAIRAAAKETTDDRR